MQSFKAVVRNGRLVLDEPTNLADGTEVDVVVREPAAGVQRSRRLSVDDLLAARLVPPPGVGPVSLSDMAKAIAGGAASRGSV